VRANSASKTDALERRFARLFAALNVDVMR
jgi:hypothetical protein